MIDNMMEDKIILSKEEAETLDGLDKLNFENYTGFMMFLNAYFERYLQKNMNNVVQDWPEGEYYLIRVTPDMLERTGTEMPWNEFTSMVVELQEELQFGSQESVLLKVTVEDYELKIEIDTEIFKWMAECPSFDETAEADTI